GGRPVLGRGRSGRDAGARARGGESPPPRPRLWPRRAGRAHGSGAVAWPGRLSRGQRATSAGRRRPEPPAVPRTRRYASRRPCPALPRADRRGNAAGLPPEVPVGGARPAAAARTPRDGTGRPLGRLAGDRRPAPAHDGGGPSGGR